MFNIHSAGVRSKSYIQVQRSGVNVNLPFAEVRSMCNTQPSAQNVGDRSMYSGQKCVRYKGVYNVRSAGFRSV